MIIKLHLYNQIYTMFPIKTFCSLLLLLLYFLQVQNHSCAFHQYAHSNHYRSRKLHPKTILMSSSNATNTKKHGRLLYGANRPAMRITLNTEGFNTLLPAVNSQPQTTMDNLNFIKRALTVSKTFYEQRLKVTPEALIEVSNSFPCPNITYPQDDIDNGIANSDLHIYALYTTNSAIGYGATGVSCIWNSLTAAVDPTLSAGRPTVGRIIFNTYNLIDTKTSKTNRLFASITSTSLHQLMHVLGFDQSLYSTYLDYNTGRPYAQVVEQVNLNSRRAGGSNYIMKTPAVTAWAIAHFGCVNITGMPLENQESSTRGIVGSHWQRLSIYDQLMTGTQLGPQKIFTALTFALLKDMGWYGVDDKFNDTTNYGYQKGCSFFFDACYSATTYSKYFCNPSNYVNVTQCSTTFTGKALCKNDAALMADGCGIFAEYFNCVDANSIGDFYQSYTLQSFSTNAFCSKGTIATAGIATTYRSRCYPYVCNYTTNSIKFTIGAYTFTCFSNEQGINKTLSGMQGNLQCPIFSDFCTNSRKICPNWCSMNGFCTRGICNCYSNDTVSFSGVDCSIVSCSNPNIYYHAQSSSCVPSCPSGYYANFQSKSCLKCDITCSQCRDQATICTSCISTPTNPQYYLQSQNICVSSCPNNTFLRTDTCVLCDPNAGCASCSGTSTFCTKCTNSSYYLNQNGNCGGTCSGQYSLYDSVNMKCQQSCPNTLLLDNGYCIRCNPGFKVEDTPNNVCQNPCPSGYFTDTVNRICGKCNQTCLACVDRYSENCTSCKQTGTLNFLHLQSMCVATCPNGFYANTNTSKCVICEVELYCSTCQVVNAQVQCMTCKYGYFLHPNKTCKANCGPFFFKNRWNNTCDPCHGSCKDCIGPSQSSCINCFSPSYFLTNQTGGYCINGTCPTGYVTFMSLSCLPCHQTCKTCNSELSSGCVTCQNNLFLENNKCRYVCSPGLYTDKTTNRCVPCNSKCKYCQNTTDSCTRCQTGYVLDNKTCTTQCPTGQSANEYSICVQPSTTTFEGLSLFKYILLLILLLGIIN